MCPKKSLNPSRDPEETICGICERIVFQNSNNGFTVAALTFDEKKPPITIVGNLLSIQVGESIEATGTWQNDRKFGRRFLIRSCKAILPSTVHTIEKYLGSGLVRGIGPVMAKRIVEKFGERTLAIVDGEPFALGSVEGIGPKRLATISKAWAEQRDIRQIVFALQEYRISTTFALKIYKRYGSNALSILKTNPYQLAFDISGIGFKTADNIAAAVGIAKDSPQRSMAGMLHVISVFGSEGHVYITKEILIDRTILLLDLERDLIETAFENLRSDQKIVVEEETRVYLPSLATAENHVLTNLRRLLNKRKVPWKIDRQTLLDRLGEPGQLKLSKKQQVAVIAATIENLLIITGGPGTGKTTLVRTIIRIFEGMKARILLASPTGRAAKRLQETTGRPAKTIHRLLEYSAKDGGFKHDGNDPIAADVLIIDETSMVDIVLFHHLLKAVPDGCRLILVGDIYQLPSVGPGNVLKDLIRSRSIPVVELNEIFRQAKTSRIVENAHRINAGLFPILNRGKENTDFYLIEVSDPEKIVVTLHHLISDRIPRRFHYDRMEDIQVLAPMNRGSCGNHNLNVQLQQLLNRSTKQIMKNGRTYKIGDKVMQTVNDYQKEVFNGDVGAIVSIDEIDQLLTVRFDRRQVEYDFNDLDQIVLAYSVSVHRYQGCQVPVLILVLLEQHYLMLQRNLLYTAVTRGEKLVIIVGTKKALGMAVHNNRVLDRNSALGRKLQG